MRKTIILFLCSVRQIAFITIMDVCKHLPEITSGSSEHRFHKAANVANIVSRLAVGAARLQSSKPSTLFLSASAKSLSSEAPDPRTLRFIYSKAVNRALADYSNFTITEGNSGQFCVDETDIVIEKLPEIYDSMLFMGQKQPVYKRKRRNLRIRLKEDSTVGSHFGELPTMPSSRTCSIAASVKRKMLSSNRSSIVTTGKPLTLPKIRSNSIAPSLSRSTRDSVILPHIFGIKASLR